MNTSMDAHYHLVEEYEKRYRVIGLSLDYVNCFPIPDHIKTPEAWIRSVLRNAALDMCRRQQFWRDSVLPELIARGKLFDTPNELRVEMRELVDSLPETTKNVFELLYQNYSVKQIQEKTGMSFAEFDRHRFIIQERLRQCLDR